MTLDIIIIAIYMIAINIIGLASSKIKTVNDYFLGNRSLPWLIVCFSIVATETSSLTFISIPGLAYMTNMGFLQIAIGYIIGRIVVALVLLPKYFEGNYETAYQFIQNRFSLFSRRIIAIIFHITRLLADGIRLFATAIPLALLLGSERYWPSIIIIGVATFIYTFYGGIKSVAIVDTIQFVLYLFSAVLAIYLITDIKSESIVSIFNSIPKESLVLFSTGLEQGSKGIFGSYNIFSGIIGGAFLSFGSHGIDHLIVQRILSCKDLKSARKAMILSGIIVFFQMALFLMLGLFIQILLNNKGFNVPDKIMPYFIIEYVPSGFKGLMLAGIFAAAMSTLSSSINSLSSSTTMDILRISERIDSEEKKIKISRFISLIWTVVLIFISLLFKDNKSPLVEYGLEVASVTYGGMISIFFQGILYKKFNDKAALAGVIISIFAVLAAKYFGVFWPWYVPIGFGVSFIIGTILNKLISKSILIK